MVDYLQAHLRTMPERVVVLTVAGELDIASATDLHHAIASAEDLHPSSILLDLSGLTFCDSSGLQELVVASTRRRTNGGLRIIDLSPRVRRTIELAGLRDLLREAPPSGP
jgi:anti-anti-sigma factor